MFVLIDNYEPAALLQTTSIERRKIFEGTIGYQIPDLPSELGILPTPNASPAKASQPSSNARFVHKIVGMGELFKEAKHKRKAKQATAAEETKPSEKTE